MQAGLIAVRVESSTTGDRNAVGQEKRESAALVWSHSESRNVITVMKGYQMSEQNDRQTVAKRRISQLTAITETSTSTTAKERERERLTFDVQINQSTHLRVSANLALVACAIIETDVFDFEDPVAATCVVDGCETRIADVGKLAGGEDFVLARPKPRDLRI